MKLRAVLVWRYVRIILRLKWQDVTIRLRLTFSSIALLAWGNLFRKDSGQIRNLSTYPILFVRVNFIWRGP